MEGRLIPSPSVVTSLQTGRMDVDRAPSSSPLAATGSGAPQHLPSDSPVSPTYTDFSVASVESQSVDGDHDGPGGLHDAEPVVFGGGYHQHHFDDYNSKPALDVVVDDSEPQHDWRRHAHPQVYSGTIQRSYSAGPMYGQGHGYQAQQHHYDATPSPTSPSWDAPSFQGHVHGRPHPLLSPLQALSPLHPTSHQQQQHHAPGLAYSTSLPHSHPLPHYSQTGHQLHHSASMQHLSSHAQNGLGAIPMGRAHSQSLSHHHYAAQHTHQAQPQTTHTHAGVDPRFVLGGGPRHSPPSSPGLRSVRSSGSLHGSPHSQNSHSPLSNVLGLEDLHSVSAGSSASTAPTSVHDDMSDADDGDSEYVDNGSGDSDGEFLPPGMRRRRQQSSQNRYAPYAGGYAHQSSAGGYGYDGQDAYSGGIPDSSLYYPSSLDMSYDDASSSYPRRPRARPAASLPPPVPVPNLTKKSRGRRVPTVQSLYAESSNSAPKRGAGSAGKSQARLYTCKVPGCGKCFARGEHLKRHVRSIHTYEKPHKCPYPGCGKDFSRNDNLGQHMRVHKDWVPGRV
ncbi:hypothetical protein HMN09_01185300 [Mycena chlorophos]|uniref:C2H2-type domain-containing protein n=1 Tax=Mycena chlorophos TaxID=658473 RepID=A0A8H6S8S8_MYCCL|nr:hypothetical protein HMN09_01185300 [Mycena chlorophos]